MIWLQQVLPGIKLLSYRDNNEKLPKGVAADINGNVTDDTNNAYSLLPIGGYKGFGLSIMVEILTVVLANMLLILKYLQCLVNQNTKKNYPNIYCIQN